jgi:Mg-chelatase subunit ChlD
MLSKSAIKFHESVCPIQVREGWHFGVFELDVGENHESPESLKEINIMLDKSGSMDEICADRSSKIDQIKHVTKNILHFVKDRNVTIGVSAFNNIVQQIFPPVAVTDSNIDGLIDRIKKVYAADQTNIGLALQTMRESASTCEDRHNIFMTDGDATMGETRSSELLKLVDKKAESNTFIGFGIDHSPEIFVELSNVENCNYYFIDKIEKSGLAYGEILHNILFRSLKNVKITVQNGLIYDWKTNSWVNEMVVGSLASESKKTFQITAPNTADVIISVYGDPGIHETFVHKEGAFENLMKMYFRQRTQELLFLAKMQALTSATDENSTLKQQIAQFTRDMKEFIKDNDLSNDPLMQNLCDDMVIVYRTLGTNLGVMYTSARQTSQGNERLFNVNDTPAPFMDLQDDAIMNAHSYGVDSPYFTEKLAGVMRDVSYRPTRSTADGPHATALSRDDFLNDYTLPDGSLYFPQLFQVPFGTPVSQVWNHTFTTNTLPLTLDDLSTEEQEEEQHQSVEVSRSASV